MQPLHNSRLKGRDVVAPDTNAARQTFAKMPIGTVLAGATPLKGKSGRYAPQSVFLRKTTAAPRKVGGQWVVATEQAAFEEAVNTINGKINARSQWSANVPKVKFGTGGVAVEVLGGKSSLRPT